MPDSEKALTWGEVLEWALSDLVSADPRRMDEVIRFYSDLSALVARFGEKNAPSNPFAKKNSPVDSSHNEVVNIENLTPLHVYFYAFRLEKPYLYSYPEVLESPSALKDILEYFKLSLAHAKLWQLLKKVFVSIMAAAIRDEVTLESEDFISFLVLTLPMFSHVARETPSAATYEKDLLFVSVCFRCFSDIKWDRISATEIKKMLSEHTETAKVS